MKGKAAEESDTALPAKKVCLALWQQYLKNYAKQKVHVQIVIALDSVVCGTIQYTSCLCSWEVCHG